MRRAERISWEELLEHDLGRVESWCISELSQAVVGLPWPLREDAATTPTNLDTLVVIGGGVLLDEAKVWRLRSAPTTRLVAVPSLWGSGAEDSPIAVLNRDGAKEMTVDDALVPDIVALWPKVLESLSEPLCRAACGDVWAHTLEALLSPIASEEVRADTALVLKEVLQLPLDADLRWFELSARACRAQAASSVGLVHGLAHVLEGKLAAAMPNERLGHAQLCSLFLWPVMMFNAEADRFNELLAAHSIDRDLVFERCREFFDAELYARLLPFVEEHWRAVLRDACTRTNSALVRRTSLDFLKGLVS